MALVSQASLRVNESLDSARSLTRAHYRGILGEDAHNLCHIFLGLATANVSPRGKHQNMDLANSAVGCALPGRVARPHVESCLAGASEQLLLTRQRLSNSSFGHKVGRTDGYTVTANLM